MRQAVRGCRSLRGLRAVRLLALTLGVGLLAACGGTAGAGGDNMPPVASPPPVMPPVTPPVVPPPETPPPAAPSPANLPSGWHLVWADEFDVDGLPDPARWDYDTYRNRQGWYNNELQYYARARSENARVAGGRLLITARQESLSALPDWGNQRYSSTRLITQGKASWTYGYFEIRARMPCGQGTWPAIWMLGTGGSWPDDGEIDILEHVGSNPTRIFGTVHTRGGHGGGGVGAARQLDTACTAFNDYQLLWTADEIAIGVNGSFYFRYPNPRMGNITWPFDRPQYLLLNIAIGGVLGGAVDDRIFPVTMEIEHVRIWQAP